jgi:hypothetical protein
LQTLLRMPRAPLAFSLLSLSGVIVFALAVGVVMQPAAQVVGQERLSELVCLQLAFTPERAQSVLFAFSAESRAAIAQLLIPGDAMLAWGYGLLLAGLTGLLAMRLPGKWMRVGAIAMWIPLLASTLDCIENVFLYAIVMGVVESPELQPVAMLTAIGGTVSTLKWIALSVLTPAFGFAGIVKGFTVDRSFGAITVYVLLFVTLLSMVAKPIQDIPACF